MVVIVDIDSEVVHSTQPQKQNWREGGAHVAMEIRDGLQRNGHYMANITVTTLAGQTFTTFDFSKNNTS